MERRNILGSDETSRFRPSRLGFGCASLGSRIGTKVAIRRVREAIDLNVTHFDVAPSYGRGFAEEILGTAVGADRHRVTICTKFGLHPSPLSPFMRLMLPAARWVVGCLPAARSAATRVAPARAAANVQGEAIAAALAESLRRLRRDHVDLLCLHDVDAGIATRPDILDALDGLRHRGMTAAIGLACDPATVLKVAGQPEGAHYDVFQFEDNPLRPAAERVRAVAGARPTLITHQVFRGAAADPRIAEPHSLLLRRALAANPDGCVLCSMVSRNHLAANAAVANAPISLSDDDAEALRSLASLKDAP